MPVSINGNGHISGLAVGGLGANVVNSTSLHNDAVTSAHMPAGSVIQVKYAQSKTTIYRDSSAYGNLSAYNVSITPTSSSNILIYQYNLIVRVRENNSHGAFCWIAISDDAGSSYLAENYHRIYDYGGSGNDLDIGACSFAIKTAGSTSARTYYIYTKIADGDSYEINPSNNQNNSAVTLMEIVA